jgi:enediyne biosynthesis protein E4
MAVDHSGGTSIVVLATVVLGCVASSPRGAREPGAITFADVTTRSGLRFEREPDLRRGRMVATMGGGVAMGDVDGDGFLDLFFTGTVRDGRKPEAGPCGVLYRNRGDGTFEDVTRRSGLHVCGWTMGASFVDVDSSGALDLVVTGLGRTTLWKNDGRGAFREVSASRGLVAPRFAVGLAAGDVDGDGRVDLYVVDYLDTTYEKELSLGEFQIRLPEYYDGQDAFLFVQGKDGRFEERAAAAGVTNHGGKGLGAVLFDYDGDGRSDLYVVNDRTPNVLYRGRGDGTFEDVTLETGAGARDQKIPRAGMGIAVGDIDGDGRPDILVTNFAGEPSTLYRNVEGVLFEDATQSSGLGPPTVPYVQWGVDFADLDDDGWPDVVIASGHLVPKALLMLGGLRKGGLGIYGLGDRSYRQPPLVLRNLGEGRFADVTASSGDLASLRLPARGLAVGDLDGDGRLDVVLSPVSGAVRLLRNTTRARQHALEILPVAGADRKTILGTKVVVTAGGRRQTREFIVRPSYASGAWTPLHFGLGPHERAERVEVIPPGETVPRFTFEDVAADRLYTLTDGALAPRRDFRR